MRLPLLLASALALAACTAHDTATTADGSAGSGGGTTSVASASGSVAPVRRARLANLPDRGALLAYTAATPVTRSAYTFHEVALSEEHALRAIATGTLELEAPDGTPIKLQYDHHVEHADGNWTWVGRPAGAQPGTEAIITFGDKAVFGTIPNGRKLPLRLASAQGHTYLMETDAAKLATLRSVGNKPIGPDAVPVPAALAGAREKVQAMAAAQPQHLTAAGAVPESATVDVVIGYTNAFATRLGGTSQALTRLNFLVDITNQAFTNSQIVGRVRLVNTVAVNYPDATNNETALRELSGVTCTEQPNGDLSCSEAPVPAALQPLVTARANYHADLMTLVRNFNDPENESCGIAWLVGGGQEPITAGDAYAGVSIVSDSNGVVAPPAFPDNGYVCRDETFAHEIAHNMGSAHDATTSMGGDGVLQPNEYGRYPYSFGYKTDAGGFYTIMAYGDAGQQPKRVYSNPRISTCNGMACGTATADNAQSLSNTIPVVASFYTSLAVTAARADFDGDGRSDLWWRHDNGTNMLWKSANINTPQSMKGTPNPWEIVGIGDFDADLAADVLWRNESTGQNVIWRSGNANTATAVTGLSGTAWQVMGVADFDGDGEADILWRNESTGMNRVWKSGNSSVAIPVSNLASATWKIVGVGDFDGDGIADILWRNNTSGQNVIWRSGNSATAQSMTTIADLNWRVVGIGDFDGDTRSDVLWRHVVNGTNTIWRSGNSATAQTVGGAALAWSVGCVADFNADARADIFWRNSSGGNTIWLSGNIGTPQAVSFADTVWHVNC